MIDRRHFTRGVCAAALAAPCTPLSAEESRVAVLETALSAIEARTGGRLGVAVLDTRDGFRVGRRTDERFPMCSTFKFLAASAILARVDAGKERLDRRVRVEPADLLGASPALQKRVGDAMSLAELCEAAMTLSDNTAANLLLAKLDGPSGLTQFVRSMGDPQTRLDRIEPALNEAAPDDPRDTTTPAAMVMHLQRLVLGDVLSSASRRQLEDWLLRNKTGDACLRAGTPTGWRVGDKTGSGERGTRNDIGILWPPGRPPIIIAAYLTGANGGLEQRNAAIASVAGAVTTAIGG